MTWPVTTRWADNDMFGHLNNAVYYQLFDTAINGWIETDPRHRPDDDDERGRRGRIELPVLPRGRFSATR